MPPRLLVVTCAWVDMVGVSAGCGERQSKIQAASMHDGCLGVRGVHYLLASTCPISSTYKAHPTLPKHRHHAHHVTTTRSSMLPISSRTGLRLMGVRAGATRLASRSSTLSCLLLQTPLASHQGSHHKHHPPSHALHTSGTFSDRGVGRAGRRWRSLVALPIRRSGGSHRSSSTSTSTSTSPAPSSSTSAGSAPHKDKEDEAPTTSTKAAAASALPYHHAHPIADENGIVGRNRELLATFTMVASVLCAIDCTVFPVLLAVLPAAEYLGGMDIHAISHSVALYVVLPIGSTTTLANWLMHRNLPLAAMSLGGLSLIFMSNYPGLEEVLMWMQESRAYNTVGCGLLMGSSWLAHRHEKGYGHHGSGEKGGGGGGGKEEGGVKKL